MPGQWRPSPARHPGLVGCIEVAVAHRCVVHRAARRMRPRAGNAAPRRYRPAHRCFRLRRALRLLPRRTRRGRRRLDTTGPLWRLPSAAARLDRPYLAPRRRAPLPHRGPRDRRRAQGHSPCSALWHAGLRVGAVGWRDPRGHHVPEVPLDACTAPAASGGEPRRPIPGVYQRQLTGSAGLRWQCPRQQQLSSLLTAAAAPRRGAPPRRRRPPCPRSAAARDVQRGRTRRRAQRSGRT